MIANNMTGTAAMKLRRTRHLPPHILRIKQAWEGLAKEPLRFEIEEDQRLGVIQPITAYGSELACLRLEHHMGGMARFSKHLNTWYYVNG
jgi:hypothetical protein